MTPEQESRFVTLQAVIPITPRGVDESVPPVDDVIAYAEWVHDGSISALTAILGQTAINYRNYRREGHA